MHAMRFARFALALALPAAAAAAEDRCLVKGKMQDQSFELKSCAVAMYDNKGVTIWFTEKPLPAATVETFHLNSYADLSGTAMSLSLCPGGNKSVVDPKNATNIFVEVEHAASPMVAQTFTFDLSKDKGLKLTKLAGELKPGGRLIGKLSMNTKLDHQPLPYSVDAEFDVTLPAKAAAAGPGCGD
jgi:hypothetical protein